MVRVRLSEGPISVHVQVPVVSEATICAVALFAAQRHRAANSRQIENKVFCFIYVVFND
jgi:hypothetical protein